MANKQVTTNSEQEISNQSFDSTFQVEQVELLGFDSANNVLRPIAVTTAGLLKVSI